MVGAQTPEAVAARLVSWLRERDRDDASVAISIDALLDDLGLAVATFDPRLIPNTLGYLEPGEDVIFVRAGLAEHVRRFTLAHELGHVILHRRAGRAAEIGGTLGGATDDAIGDGCGDLDLELLAGDDETLRPGQAYSARAQREGEANAFAAALLLPSDTTRAVYESLCARGVVRPALALARALGVSEDAALRRLAALLTAPEDERGAEPPAATAPTPTLDEDQRRAARDSGACAHRRGARLRQDERPARAHRLPARHPGRGAGAHPRADLLAEGGGRAAESGSRRAAVRDGRSGAACQHHSRLLR